MELSTLRRADDPTTIWTVPVPKLEGKCLLDHMFNRLDGMYPGKWRQNFTTEQSIKNWKDEVERVFTEEGITPAHVKPGLQACRRLYRDWPPSVPQLADACLPPVDPVSAYHEAVAGIEARGKGEIGTWSHPAIYWAASRLAKDLMITPAQQMKDRWAAALRSQLALKEWLPIPEARPALPAPGQTMLSAEDAAAMLKQLGAATVTIKPGDFDHLRWAKKLLEREAAGDKRVTKLQLKEARAALAPTQPGAADE